MNTTTFSIDHIPAVLYGEPSHSIFLFLHGKCGCKEEAAAFAEVACPRGYQVLAADLPQHGGRSDGAAFAPWDAVPEVRRLYGYAAEHWERIALRANSLGAWFAMQALAAADLEQALFASPILDMERLIRNMMGWAGVTEAELCQRGEIPTDFGETLSWRYLQYAAAHPVRWNVPTAILYAGGDNLTSRAAAEDFAVRHSCRLTVMEDGEHWFHTEPQLRFLRRWEEENC